MAPEPWWAVPDAMLGGLDVASLALGAELVDPVDLADEQQLHDGVAMTGIGYQGWLGDSPLVFTVDLAGEAPVPVAGMIIDPLAAIPALATSPRDVELLLSVDGSTWTPALAAELTPVQQDQAFALAEPVPARFARLQVSSTYGGPNGYIAMGEWQVIASPSWDPGATLNIADPIQGGHVVWVDPGASDPWQTVVMLTEGTEPQPWKPYLEAGTTVRWVVGFQDDRAAQVTELEWVDPEASDPAMRFTDLAVEVSTDDALGPWVPVGEWQLERAADGSVSPFVFAAPTWARFIRFTGQGPAEKGYWEMPATLRVLERPVGDDYRSILGAWGRNDPVGVYEWLLPPDPSALELGFDLNDGNDTPETATPLMPDVEVDARVRRGEDIDWYALTIPPDENTLRLTLKAPASAGLSLSLQDSAGNPVELDPYLMTADVNPGETYLLRVEQLPFSTVFTYDASGSMGAYLSYVSAALRGFAADITPGEEAVLVLPFDGDPLLDHWSDDPYEVENAVAGVGQVSGTSAAERALIAAGMELHSRPGAKAILIVTDAETSSFGAGGQLWRSLERSPPRHLHAPRGRGRDPALTTHLMQDWAHSWGGRYEYAFSQGQIFRAFDRLATWFRRPAAYTLSYRSSYVSHEPGSLSLVAAGGADETPIAGSGVAVEILLDTSGSMLKRIDGTRRIDVAKQVLTRLVTQTLPSGVPTALRTFKAGTGVLQEPAAGTAGPTRSAGHDGEHRGPQDQQQDQDSHRPDVAAGHRGPRLSGRAQDHRAHHRWQGDLQE